MAASFDHAAWPSTVSRSSSKKARAGPTATMSVSVRKIWKTASSCYGKWSWKPQAAARPFIFDSAKYLPFGNCERHQRRGFARGAGCDHDVLTTVFSAVGHRCGGG